jgi:hypothetical protein
MPADCTLITAETDPQLATAVARLMAADHRVDVLARAPDSPLRDRDAKRELFFGHPQLTSAEVVLPGLQNSLLVGTRST